MANGKTLLLLALFFLVLGPFGVATSLWGAKLASMNGVTELLGFRLGTAGAGILFLTGLVMLVRLWPKVSVNQ